MGFFAILAKIPRVIQDQEKRLEMVNYQNVKTLRSKVALVETGLKAAMECRQTETANPDLCPVIVMALKETEGLLVDLGRREGGITCEEGRKPGWPTNDRRHAIILLEDAASPEKRHSVRSIEKFLREAPIELMELEGQITIGREAEHVKQRYEEANKKLLNKLDELAKTNLDLDAILQMSEVQPLKAEAERLLRVYKRFNEKRKPLTELLANKAELEKKQKGYSKYRWFFPYLLETIEETLGNDLIAAKTALAKAEKETSPEARPEPVRITPQTAVQIMKTLSAQDNSREKRDHAAWRVMEMLYVDRQVRDKQVYTPQELKAIETKVHSFVAFTITQTNNTLGYEKCYELASGWMNETRLKVEQMANELRQEMESGSDEEDDDGNKSPPSTPSGSNDSNPSQRSDEPSAKATSLESSNQRRIPREKRDSRKFTPESAARFVINRMRNELPKFLENGNGARYELESACAEEVVKRLNQLIEKHKQVGITYSVAEEDAIEGATIKVLEDFAAENEEAFTVEQPSAAPSKSGFSNQAFREAFEGKRIQGDPHDIN